MRVWPVPRTGSLENPKGLVALRDNRSSLGDVYHNKNPPNELLAVRPRLGELFDRSDILGRLHLLLAHS